MSTSNVDPLFGTLKRTGRFVWKHLTAVVAISVCWFVAALPIVTIGPATVGAYAAVLSLGERGHIDRSAVLGTVKTQFVHATLLALVPLAFAGVAVGYTVAYFSTGALATGLIALGAAYTAIYVSLLAVPTLIAVAKGSDPVSAITHGYLWTAEHAVAAVALGVVTAVLFVVTSLLTIAVILLFAGVAFAFHVEFVTGLDETTAPITGPDDATDHITTSMNQ